jgi:hypothetical protein
VYDTVVSGLHSLFATLPAANRDLLRSIVEHLVVVMDHAATNGCTASCMASAWAPVLKLEPDALLFIFSNWKAVLCDDFDPGMFVATVYAV